MKGSFVFAGLLLTAGVFVASQMVRGPLEAGSSKAHAFVDLANAMIANFGPHGAGALVIITSAILAGLTVMRSVRSDRMRKAK